MKNIFAAALLTAATCAKTWSLNALEDLERMTPPNMDELMAQGGHPEMMDMIPEMEAMAADMDQEQMMADVQAFMEENGEQMQAQFDNFNESGELPEGVDPEMVEFVSGQIAEAMGELDDEMIMELQNTMNEAM